MGHVSPGRKVKSLVDAIAGRNIGVIQGQLIRIHYPTNGGSIALRTEENWDSNIQAHSIRGNGRISEFQIETERPYFYFKPVLVSDGGTMWSRGENYLAIPTSGAPLQIYPYFREDTLTNRMTEYTLPGYSDYGRFLVKTLKPLIDGKYRTPEGPRNTAVMGSSLGGVVSFYLGWQWPQVFGKVACLSSSTFAYRDDLLQRVFKEPKRKIHIYLDSGWPGDNYEATRSMRDRLIWKGYRPGSELFYLAFPEAKHDENAWAARSSIPFQFLFGKLPSFR